MLLLLFQLNLQTTQTYTGTEVEQNDAAGVPKRTSFYAPTIDLLREDDELLTIIMGYFK